MPITNIENSNSEELIERIKNGENNLREKIIQIYQNYIISFVSKMIGKPAKSSDEYSIALQAFNEAIDSFDMSYNVKFINFSSMVINRRVIDYIRKNKKYKSEYPFTYFEANENENFVENITSSQPSIFTEKMEIQEEIDIFKSQLKVFGISLEDLVKLAPKHLDSKKMCISIAKYLCTDSNLSAKINTDKKLPIVEIVNHFNISRKTVEKNRKYIVALFLILKSGMDTIKGYIGFLSEGGGK